MANTILLVDDDTDVREFLKDELESQGYSVICAASGNEALNILHEGLVPHCILTDLTMKGMTGSQFLMEIRKEPRCRLCKIITMSGCGYVHSQADVHLMKPFEADDLTKALATLIGDSSS